MNEFFDARPAKWWGQSMTIQGVLITAMTTVLPVVAAAAGVDVGLVRVFGEQAISVAQSIGGLVGTCMAITGRVRAVAPVTTRDVTIRL